VLSGLPLPLTPPQQTLKKNVVEILVLFVRVHCATSGPLSESAGVIAATLSSLRTDAASSGGSSWSGPSKVVPRERLAGSGEHPRAVCKAHAIFGLHAKKYLDCGACCHRRWESEHSRTFHYIDATTLGQAKVPYLHVLHLPLVLSSLRRAPVPLFRDAGQGRTPHPASPCMRGARVQVDTLQLELDEVLAPVHHEKLLCAQDSDGCGRPNLMRLDLHHVPPVFTVGMPLQRLQRPLVPRPSSHLGWRLAEALSLQTLGASTGLSVQTSSCVAGALAGALLSTCACLVRAAALLRSPMLEGAERGGVEGGHRK